MRFDQIVDEFLRLCQKKGVRMILVGGGAVNFHGYQRHSADVDFWIETSKENLSKIKEVLNRLGYVFDAFPKEVELGLQNISLKISPLLEIELITRFNPGKTFEQAYLDSEETYISENREIKYRVLQYRDLINSKIRAGRPKDLLDIQELQRIMEDESE